MELSELSDLVEAVSRDYARRHGFTQDATWFLLKLQEEVGELTQAFLMRTGQARVASTGVVYDLPVMGVLRR